MPIHITWQQIAGRLILGTLCAGIIGFDRDERGHTAGMRTTILVSLAACISMIQMNLLMGSNGKAADSFVVMDVMRLPLGILSGIGFIGAGAILKRGETVHGLTTAATLWFVTVMGLCFGGGQLGTGLTSFAMGLSALWGLKKIEKEMPREQRGTLQLGVASDGPSHRELEGRLRSAGFVPSGLAVSFEVPAKDRKTYSWKLKWLGKGHVVDVPPAIQALADDPKIERFEFSR
jgi:putative Mg2+ transporter-C (MgtC) family protein